MCKKCHAIPSLEPIFVYTLWQLSTLFNGSVDLTPFAKALIMRKIRYIGNRKMRKPAHTNLIKSLVSAILMLATMSALAQNAVYRWTDESGIVHYGATPPLGVEAELVKSGGPASSLNDNNPPANGGDDNSEAEGDGSQPSVQLTPEMQARKDALCKDERERLATLQKPGRIRMKQPDGAVKYLSMEEVQTEINLTKQVINDTCN